ncbi:fimbrillin family protein [Phocaeicola plebeius]|uniref:fimbrillin family protein n=1 Tax=Phocaeicola plebeius TaxID=310297 RepID=UPI0026EEFD15|nr:fimbrillin family protein [Phocaeicola plebeius]
MKNYFMKSSVALMVFSAALASCTQEEIAQTDMSARQTLNISVSTQDFVPEDGSRATTDTDRLTTFADGDAMGMYVISSDGTVICNNEKFVYNSSAWKAENELYYWKNANYIAYYPYDESLTAENITSAEAIKTKFAGAENFYTQNTAEAYEKADLMLVEVEAPADGNIQFNLSHQFSMVEINVPVRKYKTEGGFEYTAPVSLTWDTQLQIEGKNVTPYSTGKGSFRFIVPSEEELSFTLDGHLVYDEGVPVNFGSSDAQTLNLASGHCKVYNVTYEKVSGDVTTRNLEVGDFYYTDGSIYPYGNQEGNNDCSKPVKDGCIGVIFEVGTGVAGTDWTHGSVLALKSLGQAKWSANGCTVGGNVIETLSADATIKSGYEVTQALVQMEGFLWNDAANLAYNFGKGEEDSQYAAPVSSSGWYLPSIADWIAVIQNLGGDTSFTLASTAASANTVVANIKNHIKTINEELATDYFLKYTLSATEKNATDAWALELGGSGDSQNLKLLNRQKKQNQTNASNKFGACAVLSF